MNANSFGANFLKGMGSILDVFPKPPKNPIEKKSVNELIRRDWEAVGKELKNSMDEVGNELRRSRK